MEMLSVRCSREPMANISLLLVLLEPAGVSYQQGRTRAIKILLCRAPHPAFYGTSIDSWKQSILMRRYGGHVGFSYQGNRSHSVFQTNLPGINSNVHQRKTRFPFFKRFRCSVHRTEFFYHRVHVRMYALLRSNNAYYSCRFPPCFQSRGSR